MSSWIKAIGRLVGVAALIVLAMALVVGVVHWLAGWQTADEYAEGLTWAGILVIGISVLGVSGNRTVNQGFGYQYSMSAGQQGLRARTRALYSNISAGYGFMILAVTAGAMALSVAALIHAVT